MMEERPMKAHPVVGSILLAILAAPVVTPACSLAGCAGDGVELRRSFVVRVAHDGRPLAGVSITIRKFDAKDVLLKTTDLNGRARIDDLPPGSYWLDSDLLGISAGSQCFHVAETPTKKVKKEISYDWGEIAPSVRQMDGQLVESEPGQGGTPLQNALRRVDVPISGAKLKLTNPLTGAIYNSVSDAGGRFSFDATPKGTYVLNIEGDAATKKVDFNSSDMVVKFSPKAKLAQLSLEARPSGCGGIWVGLRDEVH
jgi:hypothetical protein